MFYTKSHMHLRHLALILSLLIICSCNVQKRRYTNGYYVNWPAAKHKQTLHDGESSAKEKQTSQHDKTTEASADANQRKSNTSLNSVEAPQNLDASAGEGLGSNDLKIKSPSFFPPEDSCDVLIFKDGSEVKVKVTEVGINDIKYKRCNNLEGPNHISRKSEIFMIKYANGNKEVVRSESGSGEPMKTYESQPRRSSQANTYRDKPRRIHPLAIPSLVLGTADYFIGLYCLIFAISGMAYIVLLIPVLIGLAAFIMGRLALNDIKEHPDTWKGKGFAIPGMIVGMIVAGIGLMILFLLSMGA